MKRAWMVASVLFLIAAAGFAQAPSQVPLSSAALAAILGPFADDGGACDAPQPSGAQPAAKRPGITAKSNCTAQCSPGTVSCSSAGTCVAVDRNCGSNQPGYVTCNGATTYCPGSCGTSCGNCCQCAQTGDCMACCQCDGYSYLTCFRAIC